MRKHFMIFVVQLCLVLAAATLTSRAWFTSTVEGQVGTMKAGTLDVRMKVEELPQPGFSVLCGDRGWVPGNYRKLLVTITNRGTLDAKFRLGIKPSPERELGKLEKNLMFNLFVLRKDKWHLAESGPLADYLVGGDADNWIYSDELDKAGQSNRFKVAGLSKGGILKAGEFCRLGMIIELPQTAGSILQGQEFKGKMVMQAAQVNAQEWFSVGKKPQHKKPVHPTRDD